MKFDIAALLAAKKTGKLIEFLLKLPKNEGLKKVINELWRPGAKYGNGGTADFIMKQLKYGL